MDEQPKSTDTQTEIQILTEILRLLQGLEPQVQERILHTASTYFSIGLRPSSTARSSSTSDGLREATLPFFSEDRSISPKEFMMQKQPRTDIERVACLAYYLTHYRDSHFFKTLDISKLNTEAAQVKFTNAAYAVANAEKSGLLVPAQRGHKQLSAVGEQFVLALPDREAAKAALVNLRRRRKLRKTAQNTDSNNTDRITQANDA